MQINLHSNTLRRWLHLKFIDITRTITHFQEAESVDDQLIKIKTYIKDLTDIIVESSKQEKQSKDIFDRLAMPGK